MLSGIYRSVKPLNMLLIFMQLLSLGEVRTNVSYHEFAHTKHAVIAYIACT